MLFINYHHFQPEYVQQTFDSFIFFVSDQGATILQNQWVVTQKADLINVNYDVIS